MYKPPRRDTWNLHYPFQYRFVSLYNDGHAEAMITQLPVHELVNCPYDTLTFERCWWSEGFYDALRDRYEEYREKNPVKPIDAIKKEALFAELKRINTQVGNLVLHDTIL